MNRILTAINVSHILRSAYEPGNGTEPSLQRGFSMWYQVAGELALDGLWFNFLPSWWNRNYGVSFGERWVFDPDYRTDLLRFMERTVHERFPGLGIGSADPIATVTMPDFGNAVTPALAGCDVDYPGDNYPWSRHLAPDRVPLLRVPDRLEEVFPFSEIVRQTRYLSGKLAVPAHPRFPPRGVQNDAVLIEGIEFFADTIADPPACRHLLAYSAGVLSAVIEANARFGSLDDVIVANCTTPMASPAFYAETVQPFELPLHDLARARGMRFGVHHCGVFDPYVSHYHNFPRLDFLEIGWGSDPAVALAAFPEATVQSIVLPSFVYSSSRDVVGECIEGLLEAARGNLHRYRISVPDLEWGTPEGNLAEIHRVCAAHR